MDSRQALPVTFKLKPSNDTEYHIDNEIGRGGTSIVYDAHYYDHLNCMQKVRIKECYPFELNLTRMADGEIKSSDDELDFLKIKELYRTAYLRNSDLYYDSETGTEIIAVRNIFECNNTIYIVYPYFNGKLFDCTEYNLEDAIAIVEDVAKTIARMHAKGYLYLDLKPDNIIVLSGVNKGIQLFDMDTLLPVNQTDRKESFFRISYSRGFSPLEQRKGDSKKIGEWSDVYSVGALLYFIIFGKEAGVITGNLPNNYEFANSKYDFDQYPEKLKSKLISFFQKTLPSSYFDRYSKMSIAVENLAEIKCLANKERVFVQSCRLIPNQKFIGRDDELKRLSSWLESNDPICQVYGMTGIGKSTLVKEFLLQSVGKYDSLIYTYFQNTIIETIASDEQVRIHSISKSTDESDSEYFERKLNALTKVCNDDKVLMVIDEYADSITKDMLRLVNTGAKIILISEKATLDTSYCKLEVTRLDNEDCLRLFEYHLGRNTTHEEMNDINEILELVDGHTYAVESCAKQIRYSFLSIVQAKDLAIDKGFTNIANEKIPFTKDDIETKKTIKRFFGELFSADSLSESMRMILRLTAMFENRGITASYISAYLYLDIMDDINSLIEMGWIIKGENEILRIHPIRREVIKSWPWKESEIDTMWDAYLLTYRVIVLMTESNDYPTDKLHDYEKIRKKAKNNDYYKDLLFKMFRKIGGELFALEMRDKIFAFHIGQEATPLEKRVSIINAYKMIEGGKNIPEIRETELFVRLMEVVAMNLPREYIDVSLQLVDLISSTRFVKNFTRIGHLDIGELKLQKCLDLGETDEAYKVLESLRPKSSDLYKLKYRFANGRYYDMCTQYYDYMLDGNYRGDDKNSYFEKLYESNEKAIAFYTLANDAERRFKLVECYVNRLNFLLRAYDGSEKEKRKIERAKAKAEKMVQKYCQPYSMAKHSILLADAWYATYVNPDQLMVRKLEEQVKEVASNRCDSEMDYIDEYLVPFANMYCDIGENSLSIDRLKEAYDICKKYPDYIPYQKKKDEIKQHLDEVSDSLVE